MKALIGKTAPTKKIAFLGEKNALEIKKLSGLEVKDFQKYINIEVPKLPEEDKGLAIQRYVLRVGVVGADDMTDEEIDGFPLQDISELAKEVLKYSGINSNDEGNA
jgi:hypothetical protein